MPNCKWYCSEDEAWHCDQCHPDDDGYNVMAQTVASFIVTEEEGIPIFSIMIIAASCIAAGAAVSALCIFVVIPRCREGGFPSLSWSSSGGDDDYSSAPITLGYTSIE